MNAEPRYNDTYYKCTTFHSQIIDPVLGNSIALQNYPTPIDWKNLFGNTLPVEIDVGFGKGRFLLEISREFPNINFMGIERAQKYVEITRQRFVKYIRHFSVDVNSELFKNVRLAWTDANFFMTRYVPEESVQAYHIYFPDPWPKARQQKRRIFRNKDFLDAITKTLSSGNGKLYILTDYAEYFSEIQERLSQQTKLKQIPSKSRENYHITTNFEMKYRSQGREIYRTVYEKV